MTDNALTVFEPTLEIAIAAWLDAKGKRSGSARTAESYQRYLLDFRAVLRIAALDLDSDARAVSLVAQAWAGASKRPDANVSANTFNTRLAVLGSFYVYIIRQGLLALTDPIARIERRSSHAYRSAASLGADEVKLRLKAIDRKTVAGKRDYALLAIALSTGHRVQELAALRRGDMTFNKQRITLTFRRTKGGKSASDTLTLGIGKLLVEYLHAAYGAGFMVLPDDAPLWISFSPRNKGKAISAKTLANICEKHFGTSKFHSLRHTFAHGMLEVDAKVTDIQQRLGHSSLTTTTRYLAELSRAENRFADKLADLFGL